MHLDLIFRALHLMAGVLWLGGLTSLAFAAVMAPESSQAGLAAALRKVALRLSTPAMVVAFVFGLAMLVPHFRDHYAHAAWMHAKLTLVVVASGLSGAVTGRLRKVAAGQAGPGPLRIFGALLGLLMALIVALAVLKPF
jgi:putative membrane protein